MTLLELFKLMRKHIVFVIATPLIFALAAAGVSWGLFPNQYTATVSVYVLSEAEENTSTYTDLTASQLIANDIAELAESDTVRDLVAESFGMSSLEGYEISIASSTSTRVIDISVTSQRADAVPLVANEIAVVLSTVAQEVMGVKSINIVDEAKAPASPSGPPRVMYTAVAFVSGIFLVVAAAVLLDVVNTRVRSVEEAEKLLGIPAIGHIPEIKS